MQSYEHSGLTPLERDLLDRFHARYGHLGFPPVADIVFKARKKSGAGSFTYIHYLGDVGLADGSAGLGTYSQFDAPNLEHGASFWVQIERGKLNCLEIVANGHSLWEGSDQWTVIDPDTGLLG